VFERLQSVYSKGVAYGYHLGQRPQSLYGIADSPVGLAAYFLDHDALSYALISRVFAGEAAGLTRDDVLDNITLTITTSSRKVGTSLPGNSRSSCPRICAWASGRSVIDRGRAERARRRDGVSARRPCLEGAPSNGRSPMEFRTRRERQTGPAAHG
jgi:hypothetical protein